MARNEAYFGEQARAAREAAAAARRIVHEFGDPNTENYRSPYPERPILQFPQSGEIFNAETQDGRNG